MSIIATRTNSGGGGNKRPNPNLPKFEPLKLFNRFYRFYTNYNHFIGTGLFVSLMLDDSNYFLITVPLLLGIFWWMQRLSRQHFKNRKKLIFKVLWLAFFFLVIQFAVIGMFMENPIVGIAYAAFFLFLLKLFQATDKSIPADRYLSGAKKRNAFAVYKEHHQIISQKVANGSHPNEFMNFLGMQLSTIEACLGFIFFGEVRSGKSLAISMLLPVLQYPDKRALLYDYAGNYYAKLLAMDIEASRIIQLMPFHQDCVEWLLSYDLTSPPITRVFFEQLIQSHDPKDKFFTTGAIDLACSVVATLNRTAKDAGINPVYGIKELAEFCTDEERLIDLLQTYPDIWRKHKSLATGSEQQQAYFGTLKNTFLQLQSAGECYYRARQLGRTVSLRSFADGNDIILMGREEELGGKALEFFNSAVISFCVGTIVGKPTTDDTKPASTIFIADEFHNLGKIRKLKQICTEGGKYGFSAVLATQSYKQIEELYGVGATDGLLGSITHTAFFTLSDNHTTDYASKRFGETTVLEASAGFAEGEDKNGWAKLRRTITWSEKTKPLFTPGHFKQQSKIDPHNPDKGTMGVTVRCDGENYTLNYHWHDIVPMLPPKPTAEQERLNIAPQDEELFYPTPLTDQQLIDLGLSHMVELDDTTIDDDIEQGAYEMFKEIDFDGLDDDDEEEVELT